MDERSDVLYYGGSANYVSGTGANRLTKFDWRDSFYSFGYISSFTDNINCFSVAEQKAMSFGPL